MSFESKIVAQMWKFGRMLHTLHLKPLARAWKLVCFLTFRAVLPPQAKAGKRLRLKHYGLCVVIHPNVTIGDDVTIYHNVTIAAENAIGSPYRVVIEDGVTIGVGAIVVGKPYQSLTIGFGAVVGAGAVVTEDVPPGAVVVGVPARVAKVLDTGR